MTNDATAGWQQATAAGYGEFKTNYFERKNCFTASVGRFRRPIRLDLVVQSNQKT